MRTCVAFCVYIPPKQTAVRTAAMLKCIADTIENAKLDYTDPYIIIGGDINRRDIFPAISDFPDIQVAQTGPTRGTVVLDIIATNFNENMKVSTFYPLESEDGSRKSDHLSVIAKAAIPHCHHYTVETRQVRKYTAEAEAAFGASLASVDWSLIESCLLYTSPSPRDLSTSRMPSSA